MFKKGQAAMEFLMTYGWAILVVLAAIGALAYFGVLSPSKFLPERTVFQAPLPNIDNAVVSDADDSVLVVMKNNVGGSIQILADTTEQVTLSGDCILGGVSTPVAIGTAAAAGVPMFHFWNYTQATPAWQGSTALGGSTSPAIQNGADIRVRWTCPTDSPLGAETITAGDKFTASNLGFSYLNVNSGLTREQTGSVDGKVTS